MASTHRITSEYTPSGRGLPAWLLDSLGLGGGHNLIVVHPNELHLQQTLETLHDSGMSVAPQHHLTLNRLVRLLHVDLRLPVLLDDEASTFMALHAQCVKAAEKGTFPFLHVPGVGAWTMAKTQRIQRLHSELMGLRSYAWENDPGVDAYHRLLLSYEATAGGTLPVLVTRHVLEALKTQETPPFHLSQVDGIVLLDAAPDYSEIERELLLSISAFCPVHQLLNPGSFRLGFHGAYLVDEPVCTQDTLPTWLPSHQPWNPSESVWNTEVGLENGTSITRIPVDNRQHIMNAVLSIVQSYRQAEDGTVLIVDASARERAASWSKALGRIGIQWHRGTSALQEQPMHHALLRAANLTQGMTAWSLDSLSNLFFSNTMPLLDDMFPRLEHPIHPTWRPVPDASVLDDIARKFHVLGGPGALARWLGVLGQASPSFAERRPEEKAQRLEETHWWLGCVMASWAPMLSPEDRHLLKHPIVGCSTGASLPIPEASKTPLAWMSWLISSIDVSVLEQRRAPHDAGVGALQALIDALNAIKTNLAQTGFALDEHPATFPQLLEHIGETTTLTSQSSRTAGVHVVTPEEALGCEGGLVILAGLDVDAWSMRSPVVPWLDASAQLSLGVFQSDLVVRRGRHHLRHLLNAAPHVVVFDSSPEEGGGPSAPLAEWLSDVRRSGAWDVMRHPPSFLPKEFYQGEGAHRVFRWEVREEGHGSWLTPSLYNEVETDEGRRTIRYGHSGADRRQQLGLDLHATLPYGTSANHPPAVLDAFEGAIQLDRARRQPNIRHLEEGETLPWSDREYLLSVDGLTLRPTLAALKIEGANVGAWPHLGHRGKRSVSLTVDPRPLPPYSSSSLSIAHRFGQIEGGYVREVWSPSRLETWLKCPRLGWAKHVLEADDDPSAPSEDVEARVRGQVVHEAEAAIMHGHGVPISGEMTANLQPLHLGPMGSGTAGWDTILAFLQNEVHWLGRNNAVSVHRTRDLVDATPDEWEAHESGELTLPAQGRLARMLEADLSLRHSAPLAIEWTPTTKKAHSVELSVDGEGEGFRLFGYADRVDAVLFSPEERTRLTEAGILGEEEHETPFPLDGSARTAQRLVVIRDLKTVAGPAPKTEGLRHMRCLFEDLQLALYARAWEVLHPNDRVIGVGASEIGENTVHYVELDSDLGAMDEDFSIGELTQVFPLHFPSESETGVAMSPFRRWMVERLKVAKRAVDAAAQGNVNPTPGAHCRYCMLAHSCAVSTASGGGQ